MPKVSFTYDQDATVTVATHAQVPRVVIEQGDNAIRDWLHHNPDAWSDEEEVVSTDYGPTHGAASFVVQGIEED